MDRSIPLRLERQIGELIVAGQKIQAIKLYHDHTGQGLAASKQFVESLETDLRASEPERFPRPAPGAVLLGPLGWVLLAVVLALVILLLQRR